MNETQPTPFKPLDTPDELQYWQFVAGDYGRHKDLHFTRPPFIGSEGFQNLKFELVEQWLKDQAEYRDKLANLPVQELRGCELTFKKIIDYYLEKNKIVGKTTIAMDVGAMAATSWIRLGNVFREQIESSQLVLLATNRTYSPDKQALNIPKMPEELIGFIGENQSLVRYFVADANSFSDLAITLLTGQSMELRGNIDFAHEVDSLSRYSPDPEKDIEILGRMISNDGIYLSCGGFPYSDHLPEEIWSDSPRFVAVLNAHRSLVSNLGFTLVTEVEKGAKTGTDLIYAVLRKPGAPLIEAD